MRLQAPLSSITSFAVIGFALILNACGPAGDPPPSDSAVVSSADDDHDNTPVVDPNVPQTTPTTTAPVPKGDKTTPAGTLNLAARGTGFTPHTGKNLYVGVVDPNGAAATAVVAHALIGNDGAASINFAKVLQANKGYSIAYFADTNNDGACDKNDHQYLAKLAAVTADANATLSHNVSMTQICAMLPTGKLP